MPVISSSFNLIRYPVAALLTLGLLSGCATPGVYHPISDPDFKGPELSRVRTTPETYTGMSVRWGGSIARVENRSEETWLEVVEHPLSASGRPQFAGASGGRFIARIPGFLDPAIYAEGRPITVIGTLESTTQRHIDEYLYTFPVVDVSQYQLWEERREPAVIYYYPYDYWHSWRHPFFPRYRYY